MKTCRSGLHEVTGPGRCKPCRRASQARYRVTVKARAKDRRYSRTFKGIRTIFYKRLRAVSRRHLEAQ